jgi:hypothetical protein
VGNIITLDFRIEGTSHPRQFVVILKPFQYFRESHHNFIEKYWKTSGLYDLPVDIYIFEKHHHQVF